MKKNKSKEKKKKKRVLDVALKHFALLLLW